MQSRAAASVIAYALRSDPPLRVECVTLTAHSSKVFNIMKFAQTDRWQGSCAYLDLHPKWESCIETCGNLQQLFVSTSIALNQMHNI